MGVCVCVYLLIPAVLNATKWILFDAVNMLSTLLCLLGVCVTSTYMLQYFQA